MPIHFLETVMSMYEDKFFGDAKAAMNYSAIYTANACSSEDFCVKVSASTHCGDGGGIGENFSVRLLVPVQLQVRGHRRGSE